MNIVDATRSYETWMGQLIDIVKADLSRKHERMAESAFVFLRGTFYRWVQSWPTVPATLSPWRAAPCGSLTASRHEVNAKVDPPWAN